MPNTQRHKFDDFNVNSDLEYNLKPSAERASLKTKANLKEQYSLFENLTSNFSQYLPNFST